MDCNIIEIKNVSKFYGKKQALKDINLTITSGMFGLLGRNGAGKTTLMKTLATLHKKQSGEINVCGIPIENVREIRGITGYLPQDFSMYGGMTVSEAMDYLGALSGMDKALRRTRTDELLERVNLGDKRNVRIRRLSGGMKRRLGIAQALLHDPRVLIVDEPTSGLDPEERIRFRNLLCEVAEEHIVILSTHIVGDVEASCESIAILNEGQLLWRGTVSSLLENAKGKVFSIHAEKDSVAAIKNTYTVTGIFTQGSCSTIRFLSDHTPDLSNVNEVEPNCEDAYMYCLHVNGCETTGGD